MTAQLSTKATDDSAHVPRGEKPKMKKTYIFLLLLFFSTSLVSCGRSTPERHFKPGGQEDAIGMEIESEPGGVAAELPDGKKVSFLRKLTHRGFFDESVKTLTVVETDGEKTTVEFGHGHSGYNVVELRCSSDFARVWVVDVSALHMHNAAAIDLQEGKTHPEKWGEWPVEWALPDNGKLIIRKSF